MKIIDGLKLKGRPAEIPDCSRDDLPQFFVEMGFKVGAEIGVATGEFSEKIAQAGLTLYAIDPWQAYGGYEKSPNHQKTSDSQYMHAKNRLIAYPGCTIIKKASMDAVSDFEDESLDFVYIDGNHEFKFVAEDISEWTRKVRKGGVIAGHDYVNFIPRSLLGVCHVIPVVNAYTLAFDINNWYLLGRKDALAGEKRDKWRSWMFVKQ